MRPPEPWQPGTPVFIAGQTAVGKSEVALSLAESINGEIISVDSMQVYRGMDAGTSKPSASDRVRVRHHLIDVADLSEAFDAAAFLNMAKPAVDSILNRCRTPIFCGGTGLYFKAWLQGLGDAPSSDPALRLELESMPLQSLLKELAEKDPVTLDRIDQKNPRRVVRAVEVIRISGKPFSQQQADWNHSEQSTVAAPWFFYLERSREDLQGRIQRRVEFMMKRGWVEETQRLLALGLEQYRTPMQAIGYREIIEYGRGQRDWEATVQLIQIRTRQFAKRQSTWFRRHSTRIEIEIAPEEPPQQTAARLREKLQPAGGVMSC